MNIWKMTDWENSYDLTKPNHRSGVRVKFDKKVDPEVRRACKEFLTWLRQEYFFPIRVPIYVKESEQIKANDGELVSATCFLPYDRQFEPYIRIAAGDYYTIKADKGKDNALAAILCSIIHELTHYFQWVNDVQITDDESEFQAQLYVDVILDEYAQTRLHP